MPPGHPTQDVVAPAPSRPRTPHRFRPDIQGLRAFAVLAVVADHVLGRPGGGFVGVDVFFVISGFLITGLLLREYEKTGSISPRRFYARRARRILPASLVVLVATVIAANVLFFAGRAHAVTIDALWAALFVSNWHFAAQGTDYFQAGLAVSPVQHFWSLSVEEQFYFVWPWFLLAVLVGLARLRRRAHSPRRVAGALLVAAGVASFAWAWWATGANPTSAYFSTWTRVWELGVGAALAAGIHRLARLDARARAALTGLGLVGLVASLVVITPETRFPAPGALLPVLATAALIAAGVAGDGARVLRYRPVVYIGTISYSLYLWHFPVLVFAGALWAGGGPVWYAGVFAAIAVASVLSYHLVEKPVLQSPLLLPRDPDVPRAEQWRDWWRTSLPTVRVAGPAALVVVTALVVGGVVTSSASGDDEAQPTPTAVATPVSAAAALSAQLQTAADATRWPELSPSPDELGKEDRATEWVDEGCLKLATIDKLKSRCTFGDGERHAVILGDSIAISYAPAIRKALGDGWTVRVITAGQCPVADLVVRSGDGSAFPSCPRFRQDAFDILKAEPVDLVFASESDDTTDRMVGDADESERLELLTEGWVDSLEALTATGAEVVVLSAPPHGPPLSECATTLNGPTDCNATISAKHRRMNDAARSAVAALDDPSAAHWVDADSWFCTAEGVCPPYAGSAPMRADKMHLTQVYAESLAPVLRDAIRSAQPAGDE